MLKSWNYTSIEVTVLHCRILNKSINRIMIIKYTLLFPAANQHRTKAHCSFSKKYMSNRNDNALVIDWTKGKGTFYSPRIGQKMSIFET